jgi:hypothetical protein
LQFQFYNANLPNTRFFQAGSAHDTLASRRSKRSWSGKRKKEKGRWEKAAHKGVKILGSRGNFGSGGVGKNRLMRQLYAL